MEQVKTLLRRRAPLMVSAYRLVRFASRVAYLRWCVDLEKRADHAYANRLWSYDLPRVRERYRRVIMAVCGRLGGGPWGDALEIGCAEGAFTLELAGRCRSVLACDFSNVAQVRAAEVCREFPRLSVVRLDIRHDPLPGQYDLVFVMEVLENFHGRGRITEAVSKMAGAVRAGGLLIFCDYRLAAEVRAERWSRWFLEGADSYAELIGSNFGLRLVHHEVYEGGNGVPYYTGHVIALYEKSAA